MHVSWSARIQTLPLDAVAVHHVPDTPRYGRARSYLDYRLVRGHLLGVRAGEVSDTLEIAGWAPPGHGHGAGYYFCIRLYLQGGRLIGAILFCFWDGTEASRGFRTA